MQSTPAPRARGPRSDGETTRLAILEVAGQVFAERGFADATSKEICARAEVNLAAVNYHFGSREGLYEAVLVEAHQHMLKIEVMRSVAESTLAPQEKLRKILTGIVQQVNGPLAHWGAKVVIRELLAPTKHAPVLVHKAIGPKAMLMVGIASELVGLPPTHPSLQRALFFTMAPCMAMLMAPREMRHSLFPALAQDPAEIAEDLLTYVLAGLAAIRTERS
jgi:AcrR family transcriptional regulator